MKRFLLFAIAITVVNYAHSQACGTSGTSQCTASGTITQPGLSPMSDSLAPFVNHVNSTTVIQFRNFDIVYYNNFPFTLQSLTIDTIDNLPNGLCWASNKTDDTYLNSENGCIKVNGTPCDATGQYKLRIIATATLSGGFSIQVDASTVGLNYYVRLINYGDLVTPADTTTSIAFVPYGGLCQPVSPPVVNIGQDDTVCTGSHVTLSSNVSGGIPPYTYFWSETGDVLNCDTCAQPNVTLTHNSTYVLQVTDAANSTGTDTIAYTVTGSGGDFSITANGATSFCRGGSVTLHAGQNNTFANQWQRNGVDINGETDSTYTITDSSGVYSVAYSGGGCNANSNNIMVMVNDTPSVSILPLGPVSICQGDGIMLYATDTANASYLWQLNGNDLSSAINPGYDVVIGGLYTLIVKTSANCADTSNAVIVNVNPLPAVTLSAFTPDTICISSAPIVLSGGSPLGGIYNGLGISGDTLYPSNSGTGTHIISYAYTDGNSCTNAATQTVNVSLCTGITDLDIQNSLNIFPNPASKQLLVISDFITESNTTFSISDATGKILQVPFIREGSAISFKVAILPNGIYWLKLNVNGQPITKQFIKTD